jgi:signal transduction histidine kinase/CheY-like chemotaxis protein
VRISRPNDPWPGVGALRRLGMRLRETAGRFRLTTLFVAAVLAACWLTALAFISPALAPSPESLTPAWCHLLGCLALAAPAAALLSGATVEFRRRLDELRAAGIRRERWIADLASAAERLSRLRDPMEVARRAETVVCQMLECDTARVVLGRAPTPAIADSELTEQQSVNLIGAGGERLGRLTVWRGRDRAFSSSDEMVLGHIARAVAVALDNAKLLAETAGAKSEIEVILSTISDGVFVLDRHLCVRYVNNAALRYLQCKYDEMIGASVWELFPGLRESADGERLENAIRTARQIDFSTSYVPLNAWYEMRCFPFAGGLTVYFRDVTAQRDTEEKLRQSQKLEALGQLTGGIAHDVNNLLTVILGNLEMLLQSAEERREAGHADQEMALASLRAGESASQLMNRLLTFSRRQPLSPRVVEVSGMLAQLEPLLRRTLGEQVILRITWQKALWRSLLDPVELESAILNLAINARDAMPGGGSLAIEAVNVQIDRVYATVSGIERTGDFVMLSVADTGSGMSREVLARAFDPFYTTKGPGQGTGLGLSMVYGFVKQSGGHAMIDSEPGQGTVVRLYLPRSTGDLSLSPTPPRSEIRGGDEHILLVEDNDLVREHTHAMLLELGYTVSIASNGPEVLEALHDGLRPVLLFTDVVLPGGMSGRDVADAAARLLPDLRVLFTSGYSGSMLMENGRLTPGVALLPKPFRRAELAERVREQMVATPWAALRWPIDTDRANGTVGGDGG